MNNSNDGGDLDSSPGEAPGDFDFEGKLRELEQLVLRMEEGELGLEESLTTFEHGVRLVKGCQQALERAEQKVKLLGADEDNARDCDVASAADTPSGPGQ